VPLEIIVVNQGVMIIAAFFDRSERTLVVRMSGQFALKQNVAA